ncbi:tRNA uridine(34) 5-carboxymethylaminomethyl modification radical SAM/GNAT enzyme Elp3, partial [Candidatus Pyrohabitans sp.]
MEAKAARRIIARLLEAKPSRGEVQRIKAQVARELKLSRLPSNAEILGYASEAEREVLLPLLKRKPVRTLSGIAVVAVMSKPAPCPGECIYCPRGEDAPQSYTGYEPAALRARACNYDAFTQVYSRLEQLSAIGHSVAKVELIVMGGTFPALPREYQHEFVKDCIDAMNSFPNARIRSASFEEAARRNETARVRNVGITFETRPDYCTQEHVDEMLNLGVTRVELGVQTLSDEVYRKVRRGHSVGDVIEATRVLKDAGIKVGYHMMPGLFSSFEEDLEMFRELFSNPSYRPDTLKIYPTLVVAGTELHDMWRRGEFRPYSDEEAAQLIAEVKRLLPHWVRTMRIQRDIPAQLIVAGVRHGNLAEMVQLKLEEMGARCECIRCRDAGHLAYKAGVEIREENLSLEVESYDASLGEEHFLSIVDKESDALVAYLRLRFPSELAHRSEVRGSAIVRELRVLGEALP